MQSELNQITYGTRKYLRPKLRKFPRLHNSLISFHRFYCLLTGFLHVLPDFYILGTQKGGTSSLYDYLVKHPYIEPCISKEPSYFDKYFSRGLNWYKVCFPFKFQKFFMTKIARRKFFTGEASVRYLDHPFTPERIKQVTPNAKFIILLRNPIDRAYSHHTRVSHSGRDSLSFEESMDGEQQRTKDDYTHMLKDPTYFADSYFRYSYFERGIYVDKIKRWMEVFPKEQFLIIQSEEFFSNPSKVYKEVLEFLNLPQFELKEYKVRGKVNKNRHIEPVLRKKLVEYFKPHNQRLYDFLGRKFDWDE